MNDPIGLDFFDKRINRKVRIALSGPWNGYLVFQHPEGMWVFMRKCTEEDAKYIIEVFGEAGQGDKST